MKILTFTSLFPNNVQQTHGIFVENRLKHFRESYPDVEIQVVAPVPWFPIKHKLFGKYSQYTKVARHENRGWTNVEYPRYPVIPKIGMNVQPFLMALSSLATVKRLIKNGFDFDVIDAHYFYPDGVAAALLAKWLDKPLVCTARGNDLSLLPNYCIPNRLIGWAVKHCRSVITVCQALADELPKRGYQPNSVKVLRNGVDLDLFKPRVDRDAIKQQLNLKKFTLISVGHHIERKGHHLVIQAMKELPDCELLIAGDGPMQKQLQQLTCTEGVEDRIRFLGAVKHDQLSMYYNAADIMVLASSREGWANVLLESMACGTPVVATRIWGTPEVVRSPEVGELVERNVSDLVTGIKTLKARDFDRHAVRAYAEAFSWDEVSEQLYKLFFSVVKKQPVN